MIIQEEGKGKLRLLCEDCNQERVSQRTTAVIDKKEHPCRSCSNKRNGIKRRGTPSWNSGNRKPEHEIQKGATYINYHGYLEVYVGEHEAAKYGRLKGKYVALHRKIMQDYIGRPLKKEELIHHIDGDKLNNDIPNLFLCNSMSNHRDVHNNLEEIAFYLVRSGVIEFHDGKYTIAPSYRDIGKESGEFRERLRPNKRG